MRHVPNMRKVSLVSSRSKTSSKSSDAPIPACPVSAAVVETSLVDPPRSIQTRLGTPPKSACAGEARPRRTRPTPTLDSSAFIDDPPARRSSDGHVLGEVDVLDGIQEGDALLHRPLEGLASGDETGASGALVDDGGR